MYLYWVCDRVRQVHYIVNWIIGKDNLANSSTKNNPSKHHRAVRSIYLFPTAEKIKHSCYKVPNDLQGFFKSLPSHNTDYRCKKPPPKQMDKRRMDTEKPLDIRRRIHRYIK